MSRFASLFFLFLSTTRKRAQVDNNIVLFHFDHAIALVCLQQPRKILLEQLVRCMPPDDALPDHVIMVSGADLQGCNLAGRLVERQQRAVCTGGAADVRATIACLVSKIQKL